MPRVATVPELLEQLRTFLEERLAEFEQGDGAPTLPNRAGRLNVRSLMRQFRQWGEDRGVEIPESAWQYVYNEDGWGAVINLAAAAQGLQPTRSSEAVATDDAAQTQIGRLRKDVKDQSEGHALAKVQVAQLHRQLAEKDAEIRRLRERFALMQSSGTVLRTGGVVE